MRTRFWGWSLNGRTGRLKSSSWPCASSEYPAAAARSGGFWSATASASKKSLRAAEQQRPDVARARRHWIRQQGLLDTSSLVFIDETSVKTTMARLYGRGPRGERVIGRVPLGTWKTLTFVAGLRCDEMMAPLVIDGAMNGEIFLAYTKHCLAPTLSRGDIVVMDNLSAHKVAGIKEAIEAAGAELRLLDVPSGIG
jgi:DDE superfamily endonuclease